MWARDAWHNTGKEGFGMRPTGDLAHLCDDIYSALPCMLVPTPLRHVEEMITPSSRALAASDLPVYCNTDAALLLERSRGPGERLDRVADCDARK